MPWFFISIDPITFVVIIIATLVLQRMTGHHIDLLRILCLKDALQYTVTTSKFKELKLFEKISHALLQEEFWKYIFVMRCTLYAPMRLFSLVDHNMPFMYKL